MEEEVKEVKQEKKKLTPDSTVLLTVAAVAGVIVLAGVIALIFRMF